MVRIGTLERYEYTSPIRLDIISGNYIIIPSAIILAKDIDIKRLLTFAYFAVHRGLNCNIVFSLSHILQWMGKRSDRHKNGINDKILCSIRYLQTENYLSEFDLSSSGYINAQFNLSKVQEECDKDRFAVIYLDELQLIINSVNTNSSLYFNHDVILLLFAYLRMKIFRRRNQLLPEDNNIALRKINNPEAYNCYYFEIAKELNISVRAVSNAIKALNDLGLVYSEALPRIKYNNKWRTDHTLFCNMYKREGNYQLASGEQYYLTEIKNKRNKLGL